MRGKGHMPPGAKEKISSRVRDAYSARTRGRLMSGTQNASFTENIIVTDALPLLTAFLFFGAKKRPAGVILRRRLNQTP